MKHASQVGGCVAGSRTNLNTPTPRERTTSGKGVLQCVVTLSDVSLAPTRSKGIEQCGDLRGPFRRPGVAVDRNRACQLAHRTSRLTPLRASRLLGYEPRQLDHGHRAPAVAVPASWRWSSRRQQSPSPASSQTARSPTPEQRAPVIVWCHVRSGRLADVRSGFSVSDTGTPQWQTSRCRQGCR